MTDYQDNCARHTAEQTETAAHDLSHSSEPTGTEPTFQPIATGPAKTSDEALLRLADEVVGLARRERDAFSMVADLDAADPRKVDLTADADALEATIMDRFMMLSLIRADTPAGLVAKSRAVLAYREVLQNCQVPELQPLLISMAEDAVRCDRQAPDQLLAKQDEAVIQAAAEVQRLSAINDAIWGAGPELDDDHPEEIAWHAKAKEASGRFREAVAHLAALHPATSAGLAAKAAASPALTSFWDFVRSNPHEADLMKSIVDDVQRIGAGEPVHVQDDAALLTLGRHFELQWTQERIVAARNGSDEAIKIETDRTQDFVNRIRDLPATTPAGWHVKARAIA